MNAAYAAVPISSRTPNTANQNNPLISTPKTTTANQITSSTSKNPMSTDRNTSVSRAIKSSAEQDALTSWRRRFCYLQVAGATSNIKRGARRRERRDAKTAIRRGTE